MGGFRLMDPTVRDALLWGGVGVGIVAFFAIFVFLDERVQGPIRQRRAAEQAARDAANADIARRADERRAQWVAEQALSDEARLEAIQYGIGVQLVVLGGIGLQEASI